MAIGDKAAAAGLTTWPATQDMRLGYQNDNQNADEIAQTRTDTAEALALKASILQMQAGYLKSGPLDATLRGLPLFTYGHSYLAEGGLLADPADYYSRKLAAEFALTYPTLLTSEDLKRASGGQKAAETGHAIIGTGKPWAYRPRVVVLVQALLNTARVLGEDEATRAGAKHALRSLCAVVSSTERIENTDARFVYSGSWNHTGTLSMFSNGNYSTTETAAGYVTITMPEDDCWLLTTARSEGLDPSVLKFSNAVNGQPIGTYTNNDQSEAAVTNGYANAAIKIKAPKGTSVKIIQDSGTGRLLIDALLVPAPTPPPIVLMKEPYLNDYTLSTSYPNGSDAALSYYNGILDELAVEFPNVIVCNPNTAGYWDKTKHLLPDGVHANVAGNDALFKTARDGIRAGLLQRGLISGLQAAYGLS